ncbi:MAG TPA: SpoIID/LytB domain-containing protein [Gemmatimonadales bacterium]|nr:SpoIID/LytB domain-containing protein [Gemmatimonadales bacterium]
MSGLGRRHALRRALRRAAASRLTAAALAAALAGLAAAGCIRAGGPAGGGVPGAPGATPAPSAGPPIRVGLAVGASAVTIGGGGALRLQATDAGLMDALAAGTTLRVLPAARGLALAAGPGGVTTQVEQVTVVPRDADGTVRVNGRDYAGEVTLLRDRTGVTAVNRVALERYLVGVVAGEMGRRDPVAEREALRAQAVVSRTYALRNMGRWAAQGFDLYAGVADQVYGGVTAEYPAAADAVQATRGQAVTWGGQPIDAFFFSTCGGRTAEGTEVFRGAARPYLRSVSDVGPDGAWCRISPRFRWTEEWSGAQLNATLQRTLPAVAGVRADGVGEVRDLRVTLRTGSGRVGELAARVRTGEVRVDGPQVRSALQTVTGEPLRSNLFTLAVTGAPRRITQVVAEGSGAGHGVGMCQWGAVGRARAGQRYDEILAAYYPTTTLDRLY